MKTKVFCLCILIAGFFGSVQAQWSGLGTQKLVNPKADALIGIGTATPTSALDIRKGGIRITPTTNRLALSFIPEGGGRTEFRSFTNSYNSHYFDWDMYTVTNSSHAIIRFFRRTNTTGLRRLDFLRGDGSSSIASRISVDGGDSFFNLDGGNLGVGIVPPLLSQDKLLVNGDIAIGGEGKQLKFYGGSTTVKAIIRKSGSNTPLEFALTPNSSSGPNVVAFPVLSISHDKEVKIDGELNTNGNIAIKENGKQLNFYGGSDLVKAIIRKSDSNKPLEIALTPNSPDGHNVVPLTVLSISHDKEVEVNGSLTIKNNENAKIDFKAGAKVGQIGWQNNNDQGFYVRVNGKYPMSVNHDGIKITHDDNAKIHFKAGAKAGQIGWQNGNEQGFYVRSGGKYRMSVNTNGNVAIGTTIAPSGYRLAVDGKVICEEVRVKLSQNWPDYVFEEDYELMPLDKLEAHLQEEKHLPGIPTAAEIKEQGVAVGEMQKMMMEKIEELTLYILMQQKRLEALEQELEQR